MTVRPYVADLLSAIARAKLEAPDSGRPEMVLREAVQPILQHALEVVGVRSLPWDELPLSVPSIDLANVLDAPLESRGRADAVYNRFIIEFEPPGSLRPSVQHSATRHAVQQVQQYLRGLAESQRLPLARLSGCAFDGDLIVYVIWTRSGWSVSRPQRVDADSLEQMLSSIVNLATGRGLTVHNLKEDFGPDSDVARACISAMFSIFSEGEATHRANEMLRQWSIDVGNASGPFASSTLSEWAELCNRLGLPSDSRWAPQVLFSLQTYFALVSKLVGLVVLEGTYGIRIIERMASNPHEALSSLERGTLTSSLGIGSLGAVNLFEPGIFSWYAHDSYSQLPAVLSLLLEKAREYSAELGAIEPPDAQDLLKDLFQLLIPPTIRHRLGEYYTPDWLAQHVIRRVASRPLSAGNRLLDPACGSGTFLVLAARQMLERRSGSGSASEQLRQISGGLVGFDLSPLAVQAAKVNYLLAIAPALRHSTDPVFLPIFLADSVAPPRRGGLFEGDSYVLDSSVGEWRVPSYVVENPGLFSRLGQAFSTGIEAGLSASDVVSGLLEQQGAVPDAACRGMEDLYGKLQDLHYHNRNGMWWNLIASAFAPTVYRDFDYVVGNPPWVSWETLPDSYRRSNDYLLRSYRLHPEAALARPQASRNVRLDLSMLFVARCIDKYLAPEGRLGFVITSTIFRSELAGRGFRQRHLPDGSRYYFEAIEDLSQLRLFEGATNMTSVLVATKDPQEPHYPVATTVWRGQESDTIAPDTPLEEVLDSVHLAEYASEPVLPNDLGSPLIVLPSEALRLSRPIRRTSYYLERTREGVNTRGANGAFFLDVQPGSSDGFVRVRNLPQLGRNRNTPQIQAEIEAGSVRRLLRGRDVTRGRASPSLGILFFHDHEHTSQPLSDAEARTRYPHAYEFASALGEVLRSRSRFRNFDPSGSDWLGLYSVTRAAIGENKVVYREIGNGIIAAPVEGSDIIPDHKLHVIACESPAEAQLLAKVLNSPVVSYLARGFTLSTSINASFLRYVGIGPLNDMTPDSEDDAIIAQALGVSLETYGHLADLARLEMAAT